MRVLTETSARCFAWGPWLALFCAGSFGMLGVDAAMNHHEVITENAFAFTPLIFAPVAVVVSLVGVFSVRWRREFWILGGLAILVGVAGTVFHLLPTLLERGNATVWHALLSPPRPVMAPASFAATGLILLLTAWAERWQRVR